MRKIVVAVAMVLAALASFGTAPAAQATAIGHEGCTPGYWKNHTGSWEEMTPDRPYGRVFVDATDHVASLTFLDALKARGGSGVNGASEILARASAAAFLNAASEGLGYPWRRHGTGEDGRPGLIPTVNAAFASGDRATMIALAAQLDADNNLGCPLS